MGNRVILTALAGLLLLGCLGCGSQNPEDAIHSRWNQFMGGVVGNDPDASMRVMDPAYVSQEGADAVQQRLEGFGKLLRAGRIKMADLRIDKVTVAEDGKTAVVQHSMRTKEGEWLSQAPYGSWVKVGRTWYVTWQ